ncbi:type VI secretion system Vgr family protein [Salinibacter ruber]|uniref:type VI secretion system Vgr family protein n=1 Tax=Salinibacter ruber TaxID=146919 RepID=UPI000E6D3837|nr:type VI secretion system tip protein TssI/VgrG [Salinibacter ruber]
MPSIADRAANVALYAFESAQLAPDTFQVLRFEGTEGISQPFKFELQLLSEDPDIEFSKVVNETATFTMMRGDEEVPINGVVTDFSLHGRTENYAVYRATLRPRLYWLTLSHRSRIFQEKPVTDILRLVLEEDGLLASDFRFALQGTYAPREYCVQYQETDLNFFNRLMEFEGMYYFFEHERGQDTLVIADRKSEHEKIPAPASLRYHEGAGGMLGADQETVRTFVCEEQVVTGKVQLRDYDYRKPETMTVESKTDGDMPGNRYEYGEPHFRDTSRGKRLAEVRKEEIEARKRVLTGESDSLAFRSGYVFALEGHYRANLNADYLITQISHRGSQRAGLDIDSLRPQRDEEREDEREPEYRNRFTCIPAKVQYRPPRETPKPEVPGVLTAKIESAGGDYAYIDDQGRYRARMHFDQLKDHRGGRSEGKRTLPVRMTQPYSGPDYGHHFPNHAKTEMLVAFVNGDIDRPIALGTTPNPSNSSPVVSDNKAENVIRTHAGNQLVMDDTEDETQVKLQSGDGHIVLLDDKEDRIQIASTDEHTATLDDKSKKVRVQTKDGHTVLMDDENKKVEVASKKGHFITIDDDKKKITISDKSSENIFSIDIGGDKVNIKSKNGDVNISAPYGSVNVNTNEINMESKKDTSIKAENIFEDANIDVKVNATNIKQKAKSQFEQKGMEIKSYAKVKHEIKGKKVISKGSAKNDMKGAVINVKASGMNKIQGSMVKIN